MVSITGFSSDENRKTPNRSSFFKVSTIRGSVQRGLSSPFISCPRKQYYEETLRASKKSNPITSYKKNDGKTYYKFQALAVD